MGYYLDHPLNILSSKEINRQFLITQIYFQALTFFLFIGPTEIGSQLWSSKPQTHFPLFCSHTLPREQSNICFHKRNARLFFGIPHSITSSFFSCRQSWQIPFNWKLNPRHKETCASSFFIFCWLVSVSNPSHLPKKKVHVFVFLCLLRLYANNNQNRALFFLCNGAYDFKFFICFCWCLQQML